LGFQYALDGWPKARYRAGMKEQIRAWLRRVLRWPMIVVVAYTCFLVVYFLLHALVLTIVCSLVHWNYDTVADRLNAVAYWPLWWVCRQYWLGNALICIGGIWLLFNCLWLVFVLPVKMFLWMFKGSLKVLRL
jgi:hypothetical protein